MAAPGTHKTNIGIIVLAAGESSRLGRPKQLLLYEGRPLLQHAVQVANESGADPVIVVLGADAETIKKEIDDPGVSVVENIDWNEGMASSIRCGLKLFTQINHSPEGIILMVCDQPFVTASLLKDLMSVHQQSGKPIVACSYDNTFGPPVFFHHTFFEELLELKGDVGARAIILHHTADVEVIPFPKGTYDVDTETDYERINSQ